jgi:hypothetical protein
LFTKWQWCHQATSHLLHDWSHFSSLDIVSFPQISRFLTGQLFSALKIEGLGGSGGTSSSLSHTFPSRLKAWRNSYSYISDRPGGVLILETIIASSEVGPRTRY